MHNVLLYATQPMLALGLAAVFEDGDDCRLARVCSSAPLLLEALTEDRYDLVLVEATPEISIEVLAGAL